jgi:RNA polymerase sigma-70 factor (ECF subfamily)
LSTCLITARNPHSIRSRLVYQLYRRVARLLNVSQELAIGADLLGDQRPRSPGRTDAAVVPANRLEMLYDKTHQSLFRLACRMTGDADAALDLIQETFLRAAGQPEKVPPGDGPGEAWLVRVLVNLCRDRFRKQTVRARFVDQVPVSHAVADPEATAVARDLVKAALAALAPRRRAVISLCELEELPVREVARLLGLAEVTVRWHLVVGRREMAARLGRDLP